MLGLLAKMARTSLEVDAGAVERALVVLSPRSRQILALRYGLGGETPHTLAEIAERLNVTRERIRQIEQSAIRTLGKGRTFRLEVR